MAIAAAPPASIRTTPLGRIGSEGGYAALCRKAERTSLRVPEDVAEAMAVRRAVVEWRVLHDDLWWCSGMITLLFTDIEGQLGCSRVWASASAMRCVSAMRDARGDRRRGRPGGPSRGGLVFVVFDRALDAVERAALGQRGLAAARWPEGGRPQVRIGIQTPEPTPADGDFVGMDVHGAARVMAVAHGGKCCSAVTRGWRWEVTRSWSISAITA